ncbi:MAG: isoleucine--tRNA ligase, partial [Tindallia sp. MSAO_Bac2]
MEYKDTLNLPKTDFPMRANLPNREPEILKYWEDINLYETVQKSREGKEKFILHDGPPYANGDIHMGTALNKVLKDIVVKYKTMKGFDSPFVPGWDTHGLPIEHQIIKTKKINRHEVGDLEFRQECKNYALKYVDIQREQFKRLGVRGDWSNPYLTLKPAFEGKQVEVFGEMAKRGYIYKGLKPVYWCTSCETALAEAEVEYGDRKSPSIFVKFPIIDDRGILGQEDKNYIIIWTTTP